MLIFANWVRWPCNQTYYDGKILEKSCFAVNKLCKIVKTVWNRKHTFKNTYKIVVVVTVIIKWNFNVT